MTCLLVRLFQKIICFKRHCIRKTPSLMCGNMHPTTEPTASITGPHKHFQQTLPVIVVTILPWSLRSKQNILNSFLTIKLNKLCTKQWDIIYIVAFHVVLQKKLGKLLCCLFFSRIKIEIIIETSHSLQLGIEGILLMFIKRQQLHC